MSLCSTYDEVMKPSVSALGGPQDTPGVTSGSQTSQAWQLLRINGPLLSWPGQLVTAEISGLLERLWLWPPPKQFLVRNNFGANNLCKIAAKLCRLLNSSSQCYCKHSYFTLVKSKCHFLNHVSFQREDK